MCKFGAKEFSATFLTNSSVCR